MSVIQNIGTEQAPLVTGRVAKTAELSSQQIRTVQSGSGNDAQASVVELSRGAQGVARINETKNGLNETAKVIRGADQSLEQMNEYVQQMKANLNNIVKMFPPYPPGSEDRIKFLRSFNAFRKMIDQLNLQTEPTATVPGQSGEQADSVSETGNTK